MPWTLEIHHIDVGQGDSTLIVAREVPPLLGAAPIVRSVLIDGGDGGQDATVHAYITGPAGLATLNVIALTHYDDDHMRGLTNLLTNYAPTYNNTLIYDQGWPPAGALEAGIITYFRAINGLTAGGGLAPVFGGAAPLRQRITRRVQSHGVPLAGAGVLFGGIIPAAGTPAVPPGAPGTINLAPNWLVGKEIMWADGNGNPDPTLLGGAPVVLPAVPPPGAIVWPAAAGVPQPGTPGGPPAVTCIAANQHILQPGGATVFIPGGVFAPGNARDKNQKSLVFIVEFNNFRYYIGGDIETPQEDDPAGANGIMHYLNPANNLAGRVHAMKMSHHGSGNSSSANFINRLRPSAAFVSCGINNGFGGNGPMWPIGHPQQLVIANLTANLNVQRIYLSEDRHNDDFCARVNAAIAAPPPLVGAGHYSLKTITAGAWGPIGAIWPAAPPLPSPCGGVWPVDGAVAVEGHVVINVTEALSGYAGGVLVAPPGNANFNVTYQHPGPLPAGLGATVVGH